MAAICLGKPSGESYEQDQWVAAPVSYPLGTVVQVANLNNGHTIEVQIIDPSTAKGQGKTIVDSSRAAVEQ